MNVTPAILPFDFYELQVKLSKFDDLVSLVQIDVCDGKLTPHASWPYRKEDENFKKILTEEEGMPLWNSFDFEIDLMVRNPLEEYDKWLRAGATRLVIHIKENQTDEEKEHFKKMFRDIVDRGTTPLIAFSLKQKIEDLAPYVDLVGGIQVMGIEKIGFQGQPFSEKALEHIKKVRELYPDLEISVDGGVNFDTAPLIKDAGADTLVIGSALETSLNAVESLQYFETLE